MKGAAGEKEIDFTRYSEVTAYLRHFPSDKSDEVIARLGVRRAAWETATSKWTAARQAELEVGGSILTEKFGAIVARTRDRLRRQRPTLESIGPLPGPDDVPAETKEPDLAAAPPPVADEVFAVAAAVAELPGPRVASGIEDSPSVWARHAGGPLPFGAERPSYLGPSPFASLPLAPAPPPSTPPPLPAPAPPPPPLAPIASAPPQLAAPPLAPPPLASPPQFPPPRARHPATAVLPVISDPLSPPPSAVPFQPRAPSPLGSTVGVAPGAASTPAVPFLASPRNPGEAFARAVAHAEAQQGSKSDLPGSAHAVTDRPSPSDSAATVAFANDTPVHYAPPVGVPDFTLEQYASLRVECAVYPDAIPAIHARYRISGDQAAVIDAHWRGRFAADPPLRMVFARAYATYTGWLRKNGAGGAPPER